MNSGNKYLTKTVPAGAADKKYISHYTLTSIIELYIIKSVYQI